MMTFVMLLAAGANAQSPAPQPDACKMLTLDQAKAAAGTPVTPGKPGPNDCTWKDAKGEDRVYVSLKPRDTFNVTRAQLANTGRLSSVTGVGEDAFFVTSPAGSTAYLYTLGKKHLLLLQANIPNASRQDNEAAEKGLAAEILPKL